MEKMQTILVDDEFWGLKRLEYECSVFDCIEVAGQFRSAATALEFAQHNRVDVAFLDVEMPRMNGYELSAQLRALHPGITVVYASANDKDMWAHYSAAENTRHQEFYIEKPYRQEEVAEVLAKAMLM